LIADQVAVQRVKELPRRGLRDRSVGRTAGIVQQDVDRACRVDVLTDDGGDRRRIIEVRAETGMGLAVGSRQLGENTAKGLFVTGRERHGRAQRGELHGAGAADALRAATDEGASPDELIVLDGAHACSWLFKFAGDCNAPVRHTLLAVLTTTPRNEYDGG
jgi:hypothetical protein